MLAYEVPPFIPLDGLRPPVTSDVGPPDRKFYGFRFARIAVAEQSRRERLLSANSVEKLDLRSHARCR